MQSIRKLSPFLRPYRWHLLIVIFSTLGVTAANLVNPWLVRNLVQVIRLDAGAAEGMAVIVQLTLGLLVTFGLRALFRFLTAYIAHIMAWSLVGDLRVAMYAHLQTFSPSYYADRQTGDILTRIIKDSSDLEPLFAHYIPDLIVNVLLLIGVAAILFSLNPALTLLTLIPIPFLMLVVRILGERMENAFRTAARHLGVLTSILQDNLTGIKEIQIFNQEMREHGRVNDISQRTTQDRLLANKLQAILTPSIELISSIGIVIVVWFGGQAALGGELLVEDLVAFVLYLNIFYQPITLLAQMNEHLHMAMAGSERICEILDIEPDVTDKPDGIDPGRLGGQITFEHVSFDYDEGISTLLDINFSVQPGQTLALVGPTGAGKSTISGLVPRFYDVQQGVVYVDDMDVRDIKLAALRRNISMVLQDVFLFNSTVRDNIRYSRPDATDDEVVAAAKAANAHEFILELTDGYETEIGERGVKLSGGQKQRLAIARALLKNAPILILDEATSAVDSETEAEIQEALQRLMQGKTSIVIAHRLSTIRKANLIAVIDHGEIVEIGSHHELMQLEGTYYRLYRASVAV